MDQGESQPLDRQASEFFGVGPGVEWPKGRAPRRSRVGRSPRRIRRRL